MVSARELARVEHVMGTVFTITTYDSGASDADLDRVVAWFRWVDQTFSTFRDDSEICQIARGDLAIADASADVRFVLDACAGIERVSQGRFSIRPGRVGGPGLDPAGFVKGWSVDRASLMLQHAGSKRFSIDAGGDVLFFGPAPSGGRWRVGVRHPEDAQVMGARIHINDGAVATSGAYIRGEHIWGQAATDKTVTSATVVGPSLGVADALATAVFGDQAASLAWMSAYPEYGIVLMTKGHKLRWTKNLDSVVEVLRLQPD